VFFTRMRALGCGGGVWLWRISGGYSQEMIVVFGTQIFY